MKASAFIFVFGCIVFCGRSFAQDENAPLPLPDIPHVYFEALDFWEESTGECRLDVFVEVPYEALHFTKANDMFHASYDVTVDINDSTEKLVTERYWTETIDVKTYEESVSLNTGKLSQKSFPLKPGRYQLSLLMDDPVSKKNFQLKRPIELHDAGKDSFAMSDMMIVNRVDTLEGKKAVYPNISGNVANLSSGFYLFFEVYNKLGLDSVNVIVAVRNPKGIVVHTDTLREPLRAMKNSVFVKVDNSKLTAGDYFVDVTCSPVRSTEKYPVKNILAAETRPFTVHWHGLPVSIVDLDQAIEEMQYVADKSVIDDMKNAPPEQKRDLFKAFWKKIDPTPNTERNELMEEYFSRVEYANKQFSHYIDGWKTDMGMVYIIFGVPSNVERHPFEIDSKPYEIWTYYEQNREFIFVDATGFGDYRLQNPIWDLWRTRPH
jgi:GWxTD domain-containing protein